MKNERTIIILFLISLTLLLNVVQCVPSIDMGTIQDSEGENDRQVAEDRQETELTTPEPAREYPCRSAYTLYKRYTVSFTKYYECELISRVDVRKERRTCPDGYFQRLGYCYTTDCNSDGFDTASCKTRGCGENGTYIAIQLSHYCLYCPPGYTLDTFFGQESCYGIFKEDPECPPGQSFSIDAGACV